jgi:chemotaxis-related protein WspD
MEDINLFARNKDLLGKPFNQTLLDEWTESVATIPEQEDFNKISYVVFRISDAWFALNVNSFHEVHRKRIVHTVPFRSNDVFDGITNIEGELLLKVSPEKILGIKRSEAEGGRFVIIENQGDVFVISIDEFLGIRKIAPSSIRKAPAVSDLAFKIFLNNLEEQKISNEIILDDEENNDETGNTVILGLMNIVEDAHAVETRDAIFDVGVIDTCRFFDCLRAEVNWS